MAKNVSSCKRGDMNAPACTAPVWLGWELPPQARVRVTATRRPFVVFLGSWRNGTDRPTAQLLAAH